MKHKGAKKTKIVTEETTDGLARDETNSTTVERERERERARERERVICRNALWALFQKRERECKFERKNEL